MLILLETVVGCSGNPTNGALQVPVCDADVLGRSMLMTSSAGLRQ